MAHRHRTFFRLQRFRVLTQYTLVFTIVVLLGISLGVSAFFLGVKDHLFGFSPGLVLLAFSILIMFIGILGLMMLRSLRLPPGQDPIQFKAMMTAMDEGIVAVDEHMRVLFSNRAANKIFDVRRKASGMYLKDIPNMHLLETTAIQANESHSVVENSIVLGGDDEARTLELNARSFEGSATDGVIIVIHDVTDLRKLETVRQDFVANVSHELKTPLTSIKGYVETLLNGAMLEEKTSERFLRKIDDNVSRLVALVQDLLSLAKIEAEEGERKLSPTDWNSIIQSVLARHENNLSKKNLFLKVELPYEPMVVLGDREAMTQIFENLVDNAVKYTPNGGSISVVLVGDEGKTRLSVEDSGIGIPEEDLDRVFERFYRVDKARSRAVLGTGLGLSIVKHLVSSLGGEIDVSSQVGIGTKFVVELKRYATDNT